MPIKYNYNLLNDFCIDKKIKLSKDYSNEKLFGSSKIEFYCSKCNNINIKCFTYLIKRNTLCKRCVTIESLPKQKATMLEKYGVEHASQNKEIINKIKTGFLEKYGVINPSQLEEVKNKQRKTNLEKYGVEYIVHNKESKEKMINTNIQKYGFSCCLKNKDIQSKIKTKNQKKYGTENPSQSILVKNKLKKTNEERYGVCFPLQNKEIMKKCEETNLKKYGFKNCLINDEVKNKRKNTMLERYGVEYSSQNKEIKNKIIETYNKKYGVDNPMQNQQIAEKSFNNSFLKKKYIFPSGKEIYCQGYEPFALNDLVNIFDENDILTGCKNVPTIWYNDENGEKHRHYVDIFIPSKNKCIEVKSNWTIKIKKSNIFIKQTAAKELGYEYEIWVYDCKGNKIDTYL
jgi:hypothetical protein